MCLDNLKKVCKFAVVSEDTWEGHSMRAVPIQVNKLIFASAREAARYIVVEESKLGFERKENTIAKELKRCFPKNGEHSWEMYGRWLVRYASATREE